MGHAWEVHHDYERVVLVGLLRFLLFFILVANQWRKRLVVAGTYHHRQQNKEADTYNEQAYQYLYCILHVHDDSKTSSKFKLWYFPLLDLGTPTCQVFRLTGKNKRRRLETQLSRGLWLWRIPYVFWKLSVGGCFLAEGIWGTDKPSTLLLLLL